MGEIFVIADLHFGHEKCCSTFKRDDGKALREFACADEMNGELIRRWNTLVRPEDKVYCLGDICISKRFLPLVARLQGSKRLIRGNHDIFPTRLYLEYFKEVYASRAIDKILMTHIPVHPQTLGSRFELNVHGHLHSASLNDSRYLNVSVEQTDFYPLPWSGVLAAQAQILNVEVEDVEDM